MTLSDSVLLFGHSVQPGRAAQSLQGLAAYKPLPAQQALRRAGSVVTLTWLPSFDIAVHIVQTLFLVAGFNIVVLSRLQHRCANNAQPCRG